MTWTPWTIVHRTTLQPVLPMDCADSGRAQDEALLVFRSREAAEAGAAHQKHWDVDAIACPLHEVIELEARGNPPTQDPLREHVRERIYAAQGLPTRDVVGRIGGNP